MRVPLAFYTTPRLGYTMLIKGRCVMPGAGQAEWNNTVAWTIVQVVCSLPFWYFALAVLRSVLVLLRGYLIHIQRCLFSP